MKYKTMRTTMGRKYRMRISEDERVERTLYNLSIVILPFVTAALMFAIWVKVG